MSLLSRCTCIDGWFFTDIHDERVYAKLKKLNITASPPESEYPQMWSVHKMFEQINTETKDKDLELAQFINKFRLY